MNQQLLEAQGLSSMMPPPTGILQRKCACGNHTGGGECESCRKGSVAHESFNSPGAPLDAETRAFFEPRFGHDFSHVRVHSDSRAAESARMLNAHAFTVGHELVFGSGQYAPGTENGKHLLAHELTHVVQQSNSSSLVQTKSLFSSSSDRAEQEASRVADQVTTGGRVEVKQQPAALVQGNGWLGAGITLGIGGALIGGAVGGWLGGLIGAGIGFGIGALIGWLSDRGKDKPQSACDLAFDKVRQHPLYRALVDKVKEKADDIIKVALQRPLTRCLYYAGKLLKLFETPEAPKAKPGEPAPPESNLARNRKRVGSAATAERKRLAELSKTEEGKKEIERQERIADERSPFMIERRGQDNKIYFVDNRDPNNIVVRIKVRLLPKNAVTTPTDIEDMEILQDEIERIAETRGYVIDVIFVKSDGPDVFTFTVDFDDWPTSKNPVGNARTLAHEIHHFLKLPDRYDYIEVHAQNPLTTIPYRLSLFRWQMDRQPDPLATTSLMGQGPKLMDEDVCLAAGLDLKTCVEARQKAAVPETGKK